MKTLELSFRALRRGRRTVLEPRTIRLPEGRGIGVIGLNGAGKTTFLMAAAGLLRGAAMTINGAPVTDLVVGYAPQNAPLPPWATVRDIFALFGTKLQDAAAAYPDLRLEEIDGLTVRRLTPGQKQALVTAASLMLPADVVVLDEPFTGLDFHRQSALRAALADAAARRTVIVSAQSITDILEFCDRFIIVRKGAIVFAGHLSDLGLPPGTRPAEFEKVVLDLILGSRLEVSA